MKVVDAHQLGSRIEVQCQVCGGQQLLQLEALAGRFGPDIEVENALQSYPCFYCETQGRFAWPQPVAGAQVVDRHAS